jgi:hypothetical protein
MSLSLYGRYLKGEIELRIEMRRNFIHCMRIIFLSESSLVDRLIRQRLGRVEIINLL